MKVIILTTAVFLFFLPVFGQNSENTDKKAAKKAKQEQLQQQIKTAVDAKNFKVQIDRALPMRGRTINLTSQYDFTLRGDSAIAYLPYFGVSQQASYGDTDGGIKFAEPITDYKMKLDKKKGYSISFEVRSQKDSYQIRISIGQSGYASVDITPSNSDFISYSGELDLDEKK